MSSIKNYARFYSSFNRLTIPGDKEEYKKVLVLQYTNDRTESLREMHASEYIALCKSIEELAGYNVELKAQRSSCLKLMQELGVDTTDWHEINDFCQNARIAKMPFGRIDLDGLKELRKRLFALKAKGWRRDTTKEPIYMLNLAGVLGKA
ncbi:hypothetical protein [Muribaculum gordoncarteri]|jgi:hypothetical protein|uniref:hypothetical protein n=2 Tax=Muribaculum TaxID=1918540 RepID=UPI00204F2844|nr:hypothetical protein [uncultured Muribaculum sp.]DAP28828.1 MAG TPA: hypothetical protein [Caudoviricetes sp.]